jgi:Rab9 effector protein with kelch motifs
LSDYYNFNTVSHTWTRSELDGETPSPRERSTLAPYVEDKLVLFGGYYCSPDMEVENYLNDVYVLNLSLMEWVKPSLENQSPPPRSAHTSNFVKGKMYVFGGVTSQQ